MAKRATDLRALRGADCWWSRSFCPEEGLNRSPDHLGQRNPHRAAPHYRTTGSSQPKIQWWMLRFQGSSQTILKKKMSKKNRSRLQDFVSNMIRKFRLFRFCLSQLLNVKVVSHLSFQNKIKQVCSDIPVPFPPPVSGTPHFFFQLGKTWKNIYPHGKRVVLPTLSPWTTSVMFFMGLYERHHPPNNKSLGL